MKASARALLSICCFVLLFSFSTGYANKPADQEELQSLIKKITKKVEKRKSANRSLPIIVSIGGCPGVGKSTIANMFQRKLSDQGISSLIVSLDHYGLSQEARKQLASELDPRRIQWDKLHNTLIDIKKGKATITKPCINQLTKEMSSETLFLSNIDVILLEGSYVLNDFSPLNYHSYTTLSIYLETSLENIYDWKWEREQKKPVPRTEREFFLHMSAILEDFAFHVYPSRKNADYTIQIDASHHYFVYKNAAKQKPSPDFTSMRLETLLYE